MRHDRMLEVAFATGILVVLGFAATARADCSQPPSVSISAVSQDDGFVAFNAPYNFPDTTSPSQRRLQLIVQRVGGNVFASNPWNPGTARRSLVQSRLRI